MYLPALAPAPPSCLPRASFVPPSCLPRTVLYLPYLSWFKHVAIQLYGILQVQGGDHLTIIIKRLNSCITPIEQDNPPSKLFIIILERVG